MKRIKLFEQFVNESSLNELRSTASQFQKKYSIEEIGLIRAWGTTLYLTYHQLGSYKTVDYNVYLETLKEYATLDENSEEYEDMSDWLSDNPPMIDGIPVWDKKRLEKDYQKMASKTILPYDLTVYRTASREELGLNSYTTVDGIYGDIKNQRAYNIPKGTPIIWGHGIADNDEVIWSPSQSDLKKYRQ